MNKLMNIIKRYPGLSWVFGFQLFRLLLLPFMGLMPQDAYYYMYGQNLSLSYFDHPGMIGYSIENLYGYFWAVNICSQVHRLFYYIFNHLWFP